MTFDVAEKYVSSAYHDAQEEFNIFPGMIKRVDAIPGNDLDALKRWRGLVIGDLARMEKRIKIGKEFLHARDREFHYEAKLRRTSDRIDRMRIWNRQNKEEIAAAGYQSGELG